MRKPFYWRIVAENDTALLLLVAAGVVLLQILSNGEYGFHRDELLTFTNACHLAWGYVIYPPATAFLGRVELELFGTSLTGFRLFAAVSQGIVFLLTGLIARELGGQREAQLVAATAVTIGGSSLFGGSFISYTTFDYLWWAAVAYFLARLPRSEDLRWWLAVGIAIGLGLLTKYTMAFLVLGVLGGLALTPARRRFKSPWFWCGAALALLLVLPKMIWQFRHEFVSLACVEAIHKRDIGWGSTISF
jgi:4-amino-4-deoxy-L-arabinose transferase-like glycosyltransferase